MRRPTDNRIGMRDAQHKVIHHPTHYAVGKLWNRTSNPHPTRVNFGECYFYILPVRVAIAPDEVLEDLHRAVGLID